MKRKVGVVLAICLIAGVIIGKCSEKPRIISCITAMDTAYITVLVPKWNIYHVDKLKQELIRMCLEDEFREIKLSTEDKPAAGKIFISVYISESDLAKGKEFMNLRWENPAPVL